MTFYDAEAVDHWLACETPDKGQPKLALQHFPVPKLESLTLFLDMVSTTFGMPTT